ncbi:YPDG domain-containing protein [Varibaculum vaginae]|uniref:YPDG domain-containing protein n=1 Tax=Varibaculum vaginae TaxID=2364797 RepID=UPI000F081F0C|nr:YPDG domain-containing protein [Varibaculum vaginae]
MKKTAHLAISALAAAFVILTGVLLSPVAQAEPAPPQGYTKAAQHEHGYYSECPNSQYMHVAEWTYCLNSKIYGEGDSGYWYWDNDTNTLTFDNFVLKRANFTGSYGAGTFIEPVFNRPKSSVTELTIKFKGKNVIDQQSKGHSDALTLAPTFYGEGSGNQTTPMVNIIGESPEDSLTINSDITNSDPNNSRAIKAFGASMTIGGKGTINLNPGFSGTGKINAVTGIASYYTTITGNVTVNINSNLMHKEATSIGYGVIGIEGAAVLKGNSIVNIAVNGASSGYTLGMYRSPQESKDISVAENARLSIKAYNETSPTAPTIGIYSLGNINFSTAEDAKITSSTGPAIFAKQGADFSGPGDILGSGNTGSSLRADGGIKFADGYGVYLPVAGSTANPGVADKAGKKVGSWRLSMLPPKYEEVKTEPGKAVKSPVKTKTYEDAANATQATYSAPKTVEVNGKTWEVAIDATTGELTVTPHKDARKDDIAKIPVTLSYANAAFPADTTAESEIGSNEPGRKQRIAIAPVGVNPIATPEAPSAQDFKKVKEGNWQELVIPSYGPDKDGKENPLKGVFDYAKVTYLNHLGLPFDSKDPISRGKRAEVVVPLTKEKGEKLFNRMQCPDAPLPAETSCELQKDGTVKFTVILDYKERTAKPDTPCEPCKPCGDPGTVPGGQQPGTQPGTTPGGTQPGTQPGNTNPGGTNSGANIANGAKGNTPSTPDSLVRTGSVDTTILGFGASVLFLLGFALLRRRNS